MFFVHLFFLFSLAAVVSSLSSPHAARNIHLHRSIAVSSSRVKRCKPRPQASNSTSLPLSSTQSFPLSSSSSLPSSSSLSSSFTLPSSAPVFLPVPSSSSLPHSSSSSLQPQTSTTPKPQPSNPPAYNPPSSQPPPSNPPPSGGNPISGTQTGQGTWYETGLGACGITNNDQQFIAAVSHSVFDFFPGYNGGNPNSNPVCNKKVQVTYQGKQITVAITDRCVGCMPGDLDFSPAAFSALANPALGRIDILWEWLN